MYIIANCGYVCRSCSDEHVGLPVYLVKVGSAHPDCTAYDGSVLDLPVQQSHDIPRSERCRGGEEPTVEEAGGLSSEHTNSVNK